MAHGITLRRWAWVALLVAVALPACSDEDDPAALVCPDGQALCGDRCSDPLTDPLNCGGCGEACGPGEVCNMGGCDTSCGTGLTDCNGSCRDLDTDRANCGGCGNACGAGEVCAGGQCGFNCPTGQTACGGLCVTLASDRANCGACGNACEADEICADGGCQRFCPSELVECDGQCRDVTSDRRHCGGCDVVCGPDEQCVDGACALTCEGSAPDECNGACTDLMADPANCGACGFACGAAEVCNMGMCELRCAPGLAQCGQTCTSTLTDPANCGACGAACTATATAAVSVCLDGDCSLTCRIGFDDCDDDLVVSGGNGCETDLSADVNNCGACGTVCGFANGSGACVASQCALVACDMGFDDCNAVADDGCESELATDAGNCGVCGNACGLLESCQMASCVFTPGETCASAIPLMTGTSTYGWVATNADYLLATPPCVSAGDVVGPDVLFTYTSTIDGVLTIDMTKPAGNRFVFVASDAPCGNIAASDQRLCVSNFGATSMGGSVRIRPAVDYTVYFRDTTSGGADLPNPLQLTVSTLNCATRSVGVASLSPASSSTTTQLRPTFTVTFDMPVDTSTGTVTIIGDQGTSLTFDLASSPEVSFSAGDTVLTVDPARVFPPGENLVIDWSGVRDALCGNVIPAPTWQVAVVTPPCAPGFNGMIGARTTRVPTGVTVGTEYYVAADTSTAGYVYVGGTSSLQRVPKAGGAVEDVEALAGLSAANLGYEMVIDGADIYTINNGSFGTTGRVFRISRDAGATWSVLDAVTFPTSPADDFRAAEVYGGRIYLLTHEGSSFSATQVWSFPAGVATATVARLEVSFTGQTNCSGLAVDASYYYAACGGGERFVRVDRTTGAVSVLTTRFNLSSTNNSLYGVDQDNDGTADNLYLQTWFKEGYFICDPDQATPFVGDHFTFGGGSGSYGMGFDRGARLYLFDDDNDDIVIVE